MASSVSVSGSTVSFTTNIAYFKFGSVIGFDGNGNNGGAFDAGSVRFNPPQRGINN